MAVRDFYIFIAKNLLKKEDLMEVTEGVGVT